MTIQPEETWDYKAPRLAPMKRLFGDCAIEGCIFRHVHGIPLCEDHAYAVWSEVNGWKESAEKQAKAEADREAHLARWGDEIAARTKRTEETRTLPGTIYYVQVEDLVKIGFTRDLNLRLQAYPPMARLLATHPGTFQLEKDLHRKFFNYLSARKEWFRASDELTAHIEQVRKDFRQDKRVAA